MQAMRMVVAVVLLLCALFMLGFGGFSVYGMANQPSYFRYDDFDAYDAARDSHHWMIAIVSWITFFLMGVVLTGALIILPAWWRKGLAVWGMFTCLVMFAAGFFISRKMSFDEIGWLWIIASLWLAFLFAVLGVSGFFGGKPKALAGAAAPGT